MSARETPLLGRGSLGSSHAHAAGAQHQWGVGCQARRTQQGERNLRQLGSRTRTPGRPHLSPARGKGTGFHPDRILMRAPSQGCGEKYSSLLEPYPPLPHEVGLGAELSNVRIRP